MKKLLFIFVMLLSINYMNADTIDNIADKYRKWLVGSAQTDYSNPFIKERFDEIVKEAKLSSKNFDKYDLAKLQKKFNFEKGSGGAELIPIVSGIMLPLSVAYNIKGDNNNQNIFYHNPETLKKILTTFEWLRKKGWQKGMPLGIDCKRYEKDGYIGLGGSVALSYLGYGISVFLMRDELDNVGILTKEMEMLDWITHYIGPEYNYDVIWEGKGFNTDVVRSLMNTKLCYIFSMNNDNPKRKNEMAFFQRLFNKSMEIAPGFAETIKPDYTGYHHKNVYANAYAVNSFHAASLYIYLLEGTEYSANIESVKNISRALLTNRIYCQKYDIPRCISGRFPYNLNTLQTNLPAYAYMSNLSENPYKKELSSAFMRLWNPQDESFHKEFIKQVNGRISFFSGIGAIEESLKVVNKGIDAEKDPNGYWYFPYGGLTIYRRSNWMVSWRGTSKYIWDFEGPIRKNNEYGRYNGSGVLQIYASGNPISADGSGYKIKGWNWSRLPGATTLDMPAEAMPSKKNRNFSCENYLGGVKLNEHCGMSSFTFKDNLSSLSANKTLFFINDYIFSIGTDIKSNNEKYPAQTTIAQLAIDKNSPNIYYKGKTYVDPYGHAYYLVSDKNVEIKRCMQCEPLDLSKKKHESGLYETCRIIHGYNPKDASYAYLIKVNGGKAAAKELNKSYDKLFNILRNDSVAHILKYIPENINYLAIRKAGEHFSENVIVDKVSAPCLIITKTNKSLCTIAVSNPDFNRFDGLLSYSQVGQKDIFFAPSKMAKVEVTLKGNWKLQKDYDDVHIIHKDNKSTKLSFDCIDCRTFQAELSKQ